MSLTLRWGLGVGLAIAVMDLLVAELARGLGRTDLAAAVVNVDQLISLVLWGWAGYRVAGAAGVLRAGLETAVLAGLVAGLANGVYELVRGVEGLGSTSLAVQAVSLNVVLAAAAGLLGAWAAISSRRASPPGRGGDPRR